MSQRGIIECGIAVGSLRGTRCVASPLAPHTAQHRDIVQGVGIQADRATALAIRGLLLSLAHQVEEGDEQDERNDTHNAYCYGDYNIHIGAPTASAATGIAGAVIQLGGAGHEEGRGGVNGSKGCACLSYGQHFVVVAARAVNGLGNCFCCCCCWSGCGSCW